MDVGQGCEDRIDGVLCHRGIERHLTIHRRRRRRRRSHPGPARGRSRQPRTSEHCHSSAEQRERTCVDHRVTVSLKARGRALVRRDGPRGPAAGPSHAALLVCRHRGYQGRRRPPRAVGPSRSGRPDQFFEGALLPATTAGSSDSGDYASMPRMAAISWSAARSVSLTITPPLPRKPWSSLPAAAVTVAIWCNQLL